MSGNDNRNRSKTMEQQMGAVNKATGIRRPVQGKKYWEGLWLGDVVNCRVYVTDSRGCYFWVKNAEVKYLQGDGQYVIVGEIDQDGMVGRQTYALRDVLRDGIEFVTKVDRTIGSQRDVVLAIVDMLRSLYQEPWEKDEIKAEIKHYDGDDKEQVIINTVTQKMMVTLVSEIADFDIITREEINEAFNRER